MKAMVNKGPFLRNKKSTTGIMIELFAVLCAVWFASIGYYGFNFGVLGALRVFGIGGVSILTTLIVDIVVALIKKKRTFKDISMYVLKSYSYVTALIFALCLPAGTSFYVVVLGSLFATIIGKYVFGGFGHNIFNPAIMGRIFVGLSFSDKLQILKKTSEGIDTVSGATLTGSFDWVTGLSNFTGDNKVSLLNMFLGNYQGAIGETFTFLLIAAGIYLIVRGIVNYRLTLGYLVTFTLCALGIGLVNKVDNVGTYLLNMLATGGLMFAAVFMITDPVTSPKSQDGKLIYASVAGFLAVFIRVFSSYPEGVMFSIALGNMITPLIDSSIKGNTFERVPQRLAKLAAVPVVAALLSSGYAALPFDSQSSGGGLPTTTKREGAAPRLDLEFEKINDNTYSVSKKASKDHIEFTATFDLYDNEFTSIIIDEISDEEPNSEWTSTYVGNSIHMPFKDLLAFTCDAVTCTKTGTTTYDVDAGDASVTSSAMIIALKAVVKDIGIVKLSDSVYQVTKKGFDGPITIEFTVDDTKIISAIVKESDPEEYYHSGIEQIRSDGYAGTHNVYSAWFGENVNIPFTDIDAFTKSGPRYTKGTTTTDIDVLSEATYTTNAIVDAFKAAVDMKRGGGH